MMEISPFTPDRFEYERKHLYHLPEFVFDKIEASKPTYLIGSRGTGKTTLLHALNWKQRLDNASLRQALGDDVFKKQYIGVYLRMPHFQVASLEKWLLNEGDHIRGPIFGLYLDLIWVELIAEALSEMLSRGDEFKAPPSEEHQLIDRILSEYKQITELTDVVRPTTFRNFTKILRSMRRKMEISTNLKANPTELYNYYPLGQVGEFGRYVAQLFSEFCNAFSKRESPNWYFKICVDEAECLSVFQQQVVNTSVRLSEGIAVYVISYVSKVEDITTTVLPHMTLQTADRELIVLDDMSNREFENLAEGVASVRIRHITQDYKMKCDSRQILGRLDINAILNKILGDSESDRAKELLNEAKEFTTRYLGDAAVTDIYQAYIRKKLRIPFPAKGTERWKKRSQESREIRKKMVAAYLCICRELKTEPRYAFAEMVFGMSDKCIRDFLSQLHEIYIEADRTIGEFIGITDFPIAKQHAALKRASVQKMWSLPQSGVTAPIEVGRIVDGLAKITAIVQSEGPDNKPLVSSERGKFVIDLTSESRNAASSILELIKEANEAGFLRLVKSGGRIWEFQVHCSLAAAYGFSYRGAYYECRISLADIQALIQAEDRDDFKKAVKNIGVRLSGGPPELPLFEGVDV